MMIPCITLKGPWAHWVRDGYKPIETRTHAAFKSLKGKRIGIHVAKAWDDEATFYSSKHAMHLPTVEYASHREQFRGHIICTAFVEDARWLTPNDTEAACIDCTYTERFGLILTAVRKITVPIPARGFLCAWNFDIPKEYAA